MQALAPLRFAHIDALEDAVDALLSEEHMDHMSGGSMFPLEQQIGRAEALAILAHEFRRRAQT